MRNIKRIGEQIKQYREDMGLSQSNLSDFLGVDQSLVSRIEKGERTISVDMLEKIATLFGVPLSVFSTEGDAVQPLSCAFRSNKISVNDMETISNINRIALNCTFLTELIEGNDKE